MRKPILVVMVLLSGLVGLAAPRISSGDVSVGISVSFGPPALPVYVQPPCPGPRFIWIPGYWAWSAGGEYYYWVPGTWVFAPQPGLLWTPGYWGWWDGFYRWHPGYWGPRVGFYGGINYGFGYTGIGYSGGYWSGRTFFYNRTVNNINVTVIRNTYYQTVVRSETINRVSYNGGPGGIALRPTRTQEEYDRERHIGPTRSQVSHERIARDTRLLRATVNKGRPPIAATPRAGVFRGRAVIPAIRAGGPFQPHARPQQFQRPQQLQRPQQFQRQPQQLQRQQQFQRQRQLQRQQSRRRQQENRQQSRGRNERNMNSDRAF